MYSKRVWFPLGLYLIAFLWGCSGVTPSMTPLSSPFFIPTSQDTVRLATLSRELDAMALPCIDGPACEQVHFARALVSLFENREAARASFRRVIEDNPSSPLATTSMLWLQVIGDEKLDVSSTDEQHNPLTEIAAQFVRDWMDRQLAEKPTVLTNTADSIVEQSQLVQALQRQVRERDRRIAVLRSQLDALKLIDQDHEERKRTLRVPATLVPSMDNPR